MELARVFCPPSQRDLFELWGALLHQLDEAAFELSDVNVARTKLAWWAGELASMGAAASRHPLARALAAHDAVRRVPTPEWHALVHAAMLAGTNEPAPVDTDALLAHGAPYARVTAGIEAQVFALDVADAAPDPVAVHQLLRRLEHSLSRDAAQFPWPMNLQARHQASPETFSDLVGSPQAGAALADLAGDLGARSAATKSGTLFRRCQTALDGQRLRQLARRRFERLRANGVATLWSLWRAARRVG